MPEFVWLITGCSSGFGETIALNALARGDKVIATARAPVDRLDKLKDRGCNILELDVTAKQEDLDTAMTKAAAMYGRIDALVCNAGYGEFGCLEDLTSEQWSAQLGVNFFGTINVVKAVLPHMRKARFGRIAFMNSVYAHAFGPAVGPYCVSKAAVAQYGRVLAAEVHHLNIKPVVFDIGYHQTSFMNGIKMSPTSIPEYQSIMEGLGQMAQAMYGNSSGDADKCCNLVIDVLKGEGIAAGRTMPLQIPVGLDSYETISRLAADMVKTCEDWKDVSCSTEGDAPRRGFFAQVPHYANNAGVQEIA